MLYLNPDSLWNSPFGGAPSLESGFIHNTVPEDEYTKTELEDEILKPILKVLNYKIQKTIAGEAKSTIIILNKYDDLFATK